MYEPSNICDSFREYLEQCRVESARFSKDIREIQRTKTCSPS